MERTLEHGRSTRSIQIKGGFKLLKKLVRDNVKIKNLYFYNLFLKGYLIYIWDVFNGKTVNNLYYLNY